jgi:hypothetical protein
MPHFHGRIRDRQSGAWRLGAVLISGRKRWEMSGASRWTTIEEMEQGSPDTTVEQFASRDNSGVQCL